MKQSKQTNEDLQVHVTKVKDSQSGRLTKLTDDMMVGRRVSKRELGPSKGMGNKSIVLVP